MAARVLTAVAAVAVLATDALYVSLIRGQGGPGAPGPPDVLTVPFVAGYQLFMAALLAASLFAPAATAPVLRGAASGGLVVLGVLGAFSIGLPLLIAGFLAIAATVLAIRARPRALSIASAVGAAVVSVAVLAAGFEFAWHYLVCPPAVQMEGTTAGLFGDSISYRCADGVLTTR